jgi:2-polyprenyl-6-hydroxyphenyl methylase/3-demethylubiquinone-9 3-methyltransferase
MSFIRSKLTEVAREEEEGNYASDASRRPLLRGLNVLDVGCGGGLLSESLARSGANTHAVDASEDNIRIATLHAMGDPALSNRLSYEHTSAEDLVAQGKQYDVVCSMEVLEHVDNPSLFLKSLASLVKVSSLSFLTNPICV